jgi:hypothetical protein
MHCVDHHPEFFIICMHCIAHCSVEMRSSFILTYPADRRHAYIEVTSYILVHLFIYQSAMHAHVLHTLFLSSTISCGWLVIDRHADAVRTIRVKKHMELCGTYVYLGSVRDLHTAGDRSSLD